MTCILNSNGQYSLDNFVFYVLLSVVTEVEESLIYLIFRSLKVNTFFQAVNIGIKLSLVHFSSLLFI